MDEVKDEKLTLRDLILAALRIGPIAMTAGALVGVGAGLLFTILKGESSDTVATVDCSAVPYIGKATDKAMLEPTMAYVVRTYNDPRWAVSVSTYGIFFEPALAVEGSVVGHLHVVPPNRKDGPWNVDDVRNDPDAYHVAVVMVDGAPMLGLAYPY